MLFVEGFSLPVRVDRGGSWAVSRNRAARDGFRPYPWTSPSVEAATGLPWAKSPGGMPGW
ncbi:hypothetical protein GCM10020295_78580 [Streptomyces cinereospinus]